MRLTRAEATRLIETYCGDEPLPDALDRAIEHDWTHDPRGSRALERADAQDEADAVLYGIAPGRQSDAR